MSEPRRCPQCDAEIPANSPAGLCPRCLLKASADSQSAAVSAEPGPTKLTPPNSGFEPPTVENLAPLFPQLEILELLGKGGMGAVYKARQPGLDRLVALKILPPEISRDPAFAERFQREARALARLSHPHIVAVYDFGMTDSARRGSPDPAARLTEGLPSSNESQETSGQPGGSVGDRPQREPDLRNGLCFIVMEFVDGANLRQTIRAGKLAAAEALAIVPQICEALQFAHDEGIVHRDIKPENILIDKRGRVKIADFGLAKLLGQDASDHSLTATHQVMGTLRYMAPEQMQGSREVDHRADIYSLGVVFYELLTGELPMGKFAPPSKKVQVDVRLDDVVLRALEQDPEQRYQHASEVKQEVETIRSGPIQRAAATPTTEPVDRLRDMANFWMSPQPGFGKWVGWPTLVLLAMWMIATAAVHVVFGQKDNYREGPILLVQGGGMVLLPLAFFALLANWSARQRVVSDAACRPVHSISWSTIEVTTAVAVGIACALAAVKGIFELAQRSSPLDNVSMFLTAAATVAVVVLLVLQQLGRTNGSRAAMPGFCIAVLAACAGSLPWTAVFSPIAGWLFWQGAVFASLNFLLCLGLLVAGDARPRMRAICLLLVGLIGFGLVMVFDLGPVGVIGSEFLGKITHKPGLPGEFIAAALGLLEMIAGALQLRASEPTARLVSLPESAKGAATGTQLVQAPADCLLLAAGIAFVTACGVALWLGVTPSLGRDISNLTNPMIRGNLTGMSIGLAIYSVLVGVAGLLLRRLRVRLVVLLVTVIVGLFFPAVCALNVVMDLRNIPVWPVVIPLWLGMPAALWVVVTLFRDDVRRAFEVARADAQLSGEPGGVSPRTGGEQVRGLTPSGSPSLRVGRPKLVPVLATFNLVGAILLMLACAMEEPVDVSKSVSRLWQLWETVDAILGFSMAAGLFAASIGLFLWKPWARKLTLGVCIYGLASFVFDAPYLARFALPDLYAEIQQMVIAEGVDPEAQDFVTLLTVVCLIGGLTVFGLIWLIGQLVYFTRPRVVAAFASQGEKHGKFIDWLFTGAGAVVGVLSVFGPLALLLGLSALFNAGDGNQLGSRVPAAVPPLGTITSGIGAEFTVPAGQVAVFEIVTRRDNETVPVPPHCGYVMAPPDSPIAGTFRWSPKSGDVIANGGRQWSLEIVTSGGGGGYTEAMLLPIELNDSVGARSLGLGILEPNEETIHWGIHDVRDLPANGQIGLRVTVVAHGTKSGGSGNAHIDWKKAQSAQSTTRRKLPVDPLDSLHRAAEKGDAALAKQLLDGGASINAKDGDGQTPLMKAVSGGHRSLALTLFLLGADIAEQDQRGRTAEMIAAEKRDATFLSRLKELSQISFDSDPAKRKERLRAFSGIEHSLLAGRDVDLVLFSPYEAERLKDNDGENALMKAARSGDWECFNLLATQTDTMQAQDKLGRTVLMHAVLGGHAEEDAWIERFEWLTKPPYYGVAGEDNLYVGAMLLFELERSLSVLDKDRKSLLQIAEAHGDERIAEILRRHLQMIIVNETTEIDKGGASARDHYRRRALAWQALGEKDNAEADFKKQLPE